MMTAWPTTAQWGLRGFARVDCPGLRWGFDRLQRRNVGYLVLLVSHLVLFGGELLYLGSELLYAAPHDVEIRLRFKPLSNSLQVTTDAVDP